VNIKDLFPELDFKAGLPFEKIERLYEAEAILEKLSNEIPGSVYDQFEREVRVDGEDFSFEVFIVTARRPKPTAFFAGTMRHPKAPLMFTTGVHETPEEVLKELRSLLDERMARGRRR